MIIIINNLSPTIIIIIIIIVGGRYPEDSNGGRQQGSHPSNRATTHFNTRQQVTGKQCVKRIVTLADRGREGGEESEPARKIH